uniref:chitin synthase n=1 Tax=Branchiostoma floridae TaxID=7739 RepID=C3ZKT4_BRAFL|eukprot:XP_002590824.1 hypothetical protein BRAFLDRAFT_90042 [Branchiostoma floridae]
MAEGGLEMSTLKAGVSFPLQNLTPLPGQTVSNLDDMAGHPSVKPEEIPRARKLNLPPIKKGQPGPANDSSPKAESPRVEQKSAAGKGVDNAGHTGGKSRRTGTRTLAIKEGVKETPEEDEPNETSSFSNVLSKVVKIVLGIVLFSAMSCGFLATKLSLLVMVQPLHANVSENATCEVNVLCFLNDGIFDTSNDKVICFLKDTLFSTLDTDRDDVTCFLTDDFCRTPDAYDNVTCFLDETSCRTSDTNVNACDCVTTVVTLSLAIMVPYAGVLLWSLWEGAFNSRAPWPRWHACLVGLFTSLLEVVGICVFVFQVLPSATLPSFTVLVMSVVHLFPLMVYFYYHLKLCCGRTNRKDALCVIMLSFGVIMCILGFFGYSIRFIASPPDQWAWFFLALGLLSLSWIPKIKEFEISLKKVRNTSARNRVGVEGGEESTDGTANNDADTSRCQGLTDGRANDFGARWKMGIITNLFKLLATPLTVLVIMELNKIVGDPWKTPWQWESLPLWRIDRNWVYFVAFLINMCSAFGVALLAVVACKSKLQLAFALSTVMSSLLFIITAYDSHLCKLIPWLNLCLEFSIQEPQVWEIVAVVAVVLTEIVLVLCIYLSPEEVMEPEGKLFWVPGYNAVFLDQHLLLNKKTKFNSPQEFQKKHQTSKNTHVFICTTMFRESEEEMSQLIKSIRDMATSPSEEDRRKYESHILFDDGCKQGDLQHFAIQLLSIIHKMTKTGTDKDPHSLLDECIKWQTPYGLQLQFDWKTDEDDSRGMRFFIHLKDNLIVKNKKRWSQIMYMTYILDYAAYYKPLGMESGAIEDAQITRPPESSQEGSLRLHGQSPWEGAASNAEQFSQEISIDLGEELRVTGIVLQAGDSGTNGLVTKIKVEDQEIQVPWPDKAQADSTVTCLLEEEISTTNVKIALLDWNGRDDSPPKPPCLRMELLGYAEGDLDRDTYILATDADVKFTPKSANSLLDLAQWNPDVGAVCGRTHCLGSGPMYWLQLFDYAVGHWFQKAANSTLGTVLCCPGCFSVYRCSAVRECVSTYATKTEVAKDFLMKDMGEDRWLCTLMVERGKRLVYTSIAEDSTFVPESFDEFFNQRRRWGPSTVANQIELLRKWKRGDINNSSVSFLFMLYQLLLFFSFLIGPATAILIASGGLDFYLSGSFPLEATIAIMSILTFLFGFICLRYKQDTQLKWAKALGSLFGVVMIMVMVALVEKIVKTVVDFVDSGSIAAPGTNSTFGIEEGDLDRDTYILATDADVKFTPKSANSLLDLAQWNPDVGAVCGRTHCLGSGPMYWLQLFDYAVGHWFQKLAKLTLNAIFKRISQETKDETKANDPGKQDKPKAGADDKDDVTTPLLDTVDEEEEDGDDLTHADLSDIRQEAKSYGLEVVNVPGDGNCFFRAVAHDPSVRMNSAELRKEAVKHITNNQSTFQRFLSSDDGYEDFQQYLSRMGKEGTYADHIAIQATADVLKIPIHILNEDRPTTLIKPQQGSDRSPIFVGYLRDSKHYVATRTLKKVNGGMRRKSRRSAKVSMMVLPGQEVSEWLATVFSGDDYLKNLYEPSFINNGYDDTSYIAEMTSEDLEKIDIKDDLHRERLLSHIKKLKPRRFRSRIPNDTADWLTRIGLPEYIEKFERDFKGKHDLARLKSHNLQRLFDRLGIKKREEKLHEEVRRLIEKKQVKDMAHAEPLMKKQHDIWEDLRDCCLDPDRDMFSSNDAALKKQLGDLRDSAIKVLSLINILWLVVMVTIAKSDVNLIF